MDKMLNGTEWTVRLRGGAGGWRGDKSYIGSILFDAAVEGGKPKLTIVSGLASLGLRKFDVAHLKMDSNGVIQTEVWDSFGGRSLTFELHRQHFAVLGIGPFAPPPPAPSVTTLNPNMKFRARLCGQNGGGWKGEPKFVGVLRFYPPSLPAKIEQLSFEAGFEGHPAAGKIFEIEEISAVSDGRFEVLLRQFPCLDENDEGKEVIVHRAEELVVEIHREDLAKALITSAGSEAEVAPAAAISSFSHEQLAEEVKPVMVPYNPSGEEQAQVAFYENILNNQDSVSARQHVRAVAVAMLRYAVQHPGQRVAIDMQAPGRAVCAKSVVLNDRMVRQSILAFAKSTGILPFLILERDTMRVCKKSDVKDGYAYAKGIEPFLLPVDKMAISLPATEYAVEAPVQMDTVMQEALELTRRVTKG